ncbi:pre-rRNA-processing protein esf1 [Dissophora globulifera]|uniref:Pre-rRNA-processing protein esf1 n=1 Tax=Dissophora globulifera TaxID=979702 RepID=A0A9P6RZF4_9FUNG|nr:pre-rRNA-processing protein esf1 [Dissophora globulifera]
MAPRPKKGGSSHPEPFQPIKDSRFAHVHRDPRFMQPKKKDSKVTVDSRFSSMLKSKDFSSAPKVDKYGRKLQSAGSDQQMKRFYQLQKGEKGSDEEDEEDEDEDEEDDQEGEDQEGDSEDVDGSESESEDEEGEVYDPMRGRGVISGSDSDESDIDEEAAAELDAEAEGYAQEEEEEEDDVPRGDESHRFACVNLDWDHVKATDLFKVFSGFKPEQGAIRSVRIYPSEFGKERMEREEREGPPAEIFMKKSSSSKNGDDSDSEDEDDEVIDEKTLIKKQTEEGGEEVDNDALRQYQLDRLKYFYAVVDCDSLETAKAICEACDGAEYESSANFFDLRYIPDGMEFEDVPRDEAFGAPENYKPNEFTTQVFQHSNVKLTWDEDDADRIKVTRQKFSKQDLEDMDFKAYLASSDEDSEDEDDVEATKRKYRALLAKGNKDSDDSDADSDDDDKNQEMEITFAPGLSEAASEMLEAKKQRELPVKEETSIEAYRRKEKERKLRRKEARAAKLKGSDDSESESDDQGGEALFSDDEDERLMNDPYFAEEFAGGDMMPSAKSKKGAAANKNTKKAKNDKKKRTKEERLEDNRKKAELELLMEDNRENNQHFNMKEIQKAEKKNKRKKNKARQNEKDNGEDLQDNFKIDVSDPRFSALHDSHHFALDPTNPNFKKTKAMTELLQERQKRTAVMHDENEKKLKQKQGGKGSNNSGHANNKSKNNNNNNSNPKIKVKGTFEDPSLSLLVDTVKRKSAMATEESRNGKRAKKSK